MKGDYSRDTFNTKNHYTSVRLQQGRVAVDADWNEQADITEHLREKALRDIIGHAGVPADVADSYEVFEDGGHLKVRPGRIWVDGVLCEHETEIDLGPVPAVGDHLVYLEVWPRHVTAVEDPSIREVALGGPDHGTRTQTVCTVKVADGEDLTCDDIGPGWAPDGDTDGTMAAQALPPANPSDPCVVPSQAGYTGLENHLYRVEVHQGGTTGVDQVTFKWSRDNGSIVSEWLQRSGLILTVKSLGKDKVAGFFDAEWVELGHDGFDFQDETPPGPLVNIEKVETGDDGHGLLTVTTADAGQLFDPPADSHAKVRRWDSGPIEVDPGNWQDLEENIQVQFAAGTYRTGDYWLIPARAFIGEFQGSIEWPENAGVADSVAPHGVDRRYAGLAVVTVNPDGTVEIDNCPPDFPPLTDLGPGCCTVVVQPGDSIQAAIDSLPDEGGCICLKSGVHLVDDTIVIDRSNVVLHGEGPGAVVRRTNGVPVLAVTDPQGDVVRDVRIEGIRFELVPASEKRWPGGFEIMIDESDEGAFMRKHSKATFPAKTETEFGKMGPLAILYLSWCERVEISHCSMVAGAINRLAGVLMSGVRAVTVERCRIENVTFGVWAAGEKGHDSEEIAVLESLVKGLRGKQGDQGFIGVFLESVEGPCRVERNWLTGFRMGIAIGHEAGGGIYESDGLGSTVIGNLILRTGRIEGGSALLYGIDIAADHCLVRDNLLRYRSALFGGIRLTGSHGRIEGNLLLSRAGSQPGMEDFPVGIMVGVSDANGFLTGADTVVRGNRLVGVQDAVWVAHSEGVQVLDNRIESERGELRHGVLLADTERSRVDGNRITNAQRGIWVTGFEAGNRILDNEILDGGTGIGAINQVGLQVARNRVNGMRVTGFGGGFLWGTTSLSENRFVSCGTGNAEGVGGPAIGVLFSLGPLVVESNEVLNTGIAPDGAQLQMATFGILGLFIDECRVQSNLVTYEPPLIRDPKAPDRALLLMGLYEFEIADRVFGGSAQILDNQFTGPSTESLVQIVGWKLNDNFFLRFERVFFSNNHVWHWAASKGVSVKLTGRRASVMGNHVKNTSGAPSFDLDDVRTTYMGNHAMGGVIGSANVRPVAINDFNFEF